MAVARLRRVFFNSVAIPVLQGTGSYRPTSESLTAVVDSSGQKIYETSEPQAGMMKMNLSVVNSNDEKTIRAFRDGEIIMEFESGKTVVGSLMSHSSNNDVSETDGFLECEFTGNVRVV